MEAATAEAATAEAAAKTAATEAAAEAPTGICRGRRKGTERCHRGEGNHVLRNMTTSLHNVRGHKRCRRRIVALLAGGTSITRVYAHAEKLIAEGANDDQLKAGIRDFLGC